MSAVTVDAAALADLGEQLIARLGTDATVQRLEQHDETAEALQFLAELTEALQRHLDGNVVLASVDAADALRSALARYRTALDAVVQSVGIPPTETTDDGLQAERGAAVVQQLLFTHYARLSREAARTDAAVHGLTELADVALSATMRALIERMPRSRPYALASALTDAVQLKLNGTGGGTWTLYQSPDRGPAIFRGSSCISSTTVTASTADFVDTVLSPVRSDGISPSLTVHGDVALGQRVLVALHQR